MILLLLLVRTLKKKELSWLYFTLFQVYFKKKYIFPPLRSFKAFSSVLIAKYELVDAELS